MESAADVHRLIRRTAQVPAIRAGDDWLLKLAGYNSAVAMAALRNRFLLAEADVAPEQDKLNEKAIRLAASISLGPSEAAAVPTAADRE